MIGRRHRKQECQFLNRVDRGKRSEVVVLNPHSALTRLLPVCTVCGVEKMEPRAVWLDGVRLEPEDALRRVK